jgi:TetR/AcrR family transcriptional regulator
VAARRARIAKSSSEDRKGRLLEAAITEFAGRGLAGARVDSIARSAEANKQLLYHYFGDKAQLEREVISAVMRRQDEEDEKHPKASSLKEYVAQRCRRGSIGTLGGLWARLLAWEALEHGASGVVHFEQRRARYDERVIGPIRDSQAAGEIDDKFDPNFLALAIFAIELIPRVLPNVTRMVTGYSGDEPEFTDELAHIMEELVVHLSRI